jgi:hypothetical protein
MSAGCDHKRYSCAEVGCIGDPGGLSEERLREIVAGDDAEDAETARMELAMRGVDIDTLHGEQQVKGGEG